MKAEISAMIKVNNVLSKLKPDQALRVANYVQHWAADQYDETLRKPLLPASAPMAAQSQQPLNGV